MPVEPLVVPSIVDRAPSEALMYYGAFATGSIAYASLPVASNEPSKYVLLDNPEFLDRSVNMLLADVP